MLVLSQLCSQLGLKHFHDVAEISYKTKTGEEVTGEMDEFLFYFLSCRNCADVYDKTKFIRIDCDFLSSFCFCFISVLSQ